ncbi:unnamed protein product [Dracunculus medinensis]|uniref:PNPLA domain-containing protein n=1 Tax=Dracunculus medinensis TaxID=318479 RepID=A0A0N4UGC6_DRAME|nr:unnamed protein product [Dracunculus medinensis]
MRSKIFAETTELALSFSGCGFLGIYHFGVLACLSTNGKVRSKLKRCGGSSAGSIAATILLLTPHKIQDALKKFYLLAEEVNGLPLGAFTPGFSLNDRLISLVDDHIPSDVSSLQDRLFISVTNYKSGENKILSRFNSRDYLVRCITASCFIPLYSMGSDMMAQPPVIDNEVYIDGGFSNNLPLFDDIPTVTVSPFSGGAVISPRDNNPYMPYVEWRVRFRNQEMNVNLRNIMRGAQALFPPSCQLLRNYYKQGFKDAFAFLIENDILERREGSSV